MTTIDPANLEEYGQLEHKFWQLLRQTFRSVFNRSAEPIDAYRKLLFDASPYERLLALHDDPLDVASVLTGIAITPEIESRYDSVGGEIYPPEPEIYEVVLANPPYWGTAFHPREQERLQSREHERTSRLVSATAFSRGMERLGYRLAKQSGNAVIWAFDYQKRHAAGLPEVVTARGPMYRRAQGDLAYDVQSVLDVYELIIMLAAYQHAPEDTLRRIERLRDAFVRPYVYPWR